MGQYIQQTQHQVALSKKQSKNSEEKRKTLVILCSFEKANLYSCKHICHS